MKTNDTGKESKEVVVTADDGTKYVVVHVTGYIRHWPNGTIALNFKNLILHEIKFYGI